MYAWTREVGEGAGSVAPAGRNSARHKSDMRECSERAKDFSFRWGWVMRRWRGSGSGLPDAHVGKSRWQACVIAISSLYSGSAHCAHSPDPKGFFGLSDCKDSGHVLPRRHLAIRWYGIKERFHPSRSQMHSILALVFMDGSVEGFNPLHREIHVGRRDLMRESSW